MFQRKELKIFNEKAKRSAGLSLVFLFFIFCILCVNLSYFRPINDLNFI